MAENEVEVKTELSKEDEEYLNGIPSRMEVANFVNALLEEKYLPHLLNQDEKVEATCRFAIMAIQAILIQKGICTAEEFQEASESIIKAAQEERKRAEEDSQESKEPEFETDSNLE